MRTRGQSQARVGKAHWRSRRGMLEVEAELLPFARKHFDGLPVADQEAYIRLLEEDDWCIHDWLRGRSHPTDMALKRMIVLIRRTSEAGWRCE